MRRLLLAAIAVLPLAAGGASAAPLTFRAFLSGPAEEPPVASPGTGTATVVLDTVANTLRVTADFGGLLSPTIFAHVHCCTPTPLAGVSPVAVAPMNLPGFPVGVTSGVYDRLLNSEDAAIYTPTFVATFGGGTIPGAEAALLAGLQSGRAYFNIHTETFRGGEIRGFFAPVPTPMSLALFGTGLVGLVALRRRPRAAS